MSMPAITLSTLGWSAPDGTAVLAGLDFRFAPERIGLIGRNGVGKSSLLALIAGECTPTHGHVTIDGRIAVLRQNLEPAPGATIADLFDAREALAVIDRAEVGSATLDELDACDWTLPARLADALADVALSADPATLLTTLSGGQRTRAALAAALFTQPDFLLLAEPTNHLDVISQHWLENYLRGYQGAILVISHDRAFLETVTERTLELKMGTLNSYKGNYSFYLKESAARKERQRKASVNQKKEKL